MDRYLRELNCGRRLVTFCRAVAALFGLVVAFALARADALAPNSLVHKSPASVVGGRVATVGAVPAEASVAEGAKAVESAISVSPSRAVIARTVGTAHV